MTQSREPSINPLGFHGNSKYHQVDSQDLPSYVPCPGDWHDPVPLICVVVFWLTFGRCWLSVQIDSWSVDSWSQRGGGGKSNSVPWAPLKQTTVLGMGKLSGFGHRWHSSWVLTFSPALSPLWRLFISWPQFSHLEVATNNVYLKETSVSCDLSTSNRC